MPITPRVSVLLTAYNREDYIAQAIESVLAQSMTDFELIICDDQSSDGTAGIIDRFARRDPRIRFSINERNLGQFENRRHAASLASGAFLKYHDSDDVMYPHCLATMVGPLDAEPRAAFALSAAGYWPGGRCPMLLTPELAYQREFLGSGLFHLGPPAAMFRTQAFRDLGGFPTAGVGSDYLFWLKACAIVNVLLVPGNLFFYRLHAGQELVSATAVRDYAQMSAIAWDVLNSPECPLTGGAREIAKRNFVFGQTRGVYRNLKAGRIRDAATTVRHLGLRPRDWVSYLRLPHRTASAGTPAREEDPCR
jgi:glycosyltransferase involved in cell wall biosynthesis